MTLKECTAILTPLALALRAEMDAPTYRAYHRALEKVPTQLLQSAADRAMQTATFMPKAGELIALAEERRQEIAAAHPYERCSACNYTGTVRLERANWMEGKAPKYGRCQCWHTHQKRLEALGISDQPLALPAAREMSHVTDI